MVDIIRLTLRCRRPDSQTLEAFHEYLQIDIVRENGGTLTTRATIVHPGRQMRRGRVKFGQEETSLAPALIANDVSRQREAIDQEFLSVRDWCFEQLLEVLVAFLLLVARLSPLRDGFAVEDEYVKEGIEKEDHVSLDRNAVQ